MKIIVGFCFLLFIEVNLYAQTTPLHTFADNSNQWITYNGDHKISERWGIHLEGSWRRNDFFTKPQQLLFRTGINFHFNPQVFASVGYCFVESYPYGGFPAKSSFPENRFWEQLQIRTSLQKFEWVSRFRLEQRFVQTPVMNMVNVYEPGDAVYSNRFRVMNRFSLPLKGRVIADKSYYLTTFDELLVSFGDNVGSNAFDQNRAYFALGYKIPKLGRFELGYLLQTIFKADGIKIERNHTLQIGLNSTMDFFSRKAEGVSRK